MCIVWCVCVSIVFTCAANDRSVYITRTDNWQVFVLIMSECRRHSVEFSALYFIRLFVFHRISRLHISSIWHYIVHNANDRVKAQDVDRNERLYSCSVRYFNWSVCALLRCLLYVCVLLLSNNLYLFVNIFCSFFYVLKYWKKKYGDSCGQLLLLYTIRITKIIVKNDKHATQIDICASFSFVVVDVLRISVRREQSKSRFTTTKKHAKEEEAV